MAEASPQMKMVDSDIADFSDACRYCWFAVTPALTMAAAPSVSGVVNSFADRQSTETVMLDSYTIGIDDGVPA